MNDALKNSLHNTILILMKEEEVTIGAHSDPFSIEIY